MRNLPLGRSPLPLVSTSKSWRGWVKFKSSKFFFISNLNLERHFIGSNSQPKASGKVVKSGLKIILGGIYLLCSLLTRR